MKDESQQIKSRVDGALANPEIDTIYFNGFAVSLGLGDIAMVLERNGRPTAVINTSYTVAKTLSQKLHGLIAELEQKTANTIMTTDDVRGRMLDTGDQENV